MTEGRILTPYEMGLASALVLIGQALAEVSRNDADNLIAAAKRLQDVHPEEPKLRDGQGEHQSALQSLIRGLELGRDA
ncbi:hypothetical protein [Pseudomonas fluorescens]